MYIEKFTQRPQERDAAERARRGGGVLGPRGENKIDRRINDNLQRAWRSRMIAD